jgi:hypothetical protein
MISVGTYAIDINRVGIDRTPETGSNQSWRNYQT